MTATAIAIIASSQAIQAQEMARRTECKLVLSNYPSTPTLSEQREYAGCVYKLYGTGEPLSHNDVIAIKILILIAIIGAVIGFIKHKQDRYYGSDYIDAFMMPLMGSIILPIALFILGGACYGVFYLFFG